MSVMPHLVNIAPGILFPIIAKVTTHLLLFLFGLGLRQIFLQTYVRGAAGGPHQILDLPVYLGNY